MADVRRLCDEVAVLRGGRVAFQGTLADLTGGPQEGDVDSLEDALEAIYAEPNYAEPSFAGAAS